MKQKARACFKISDCVYLQKFASHLLLPEFQMSLRGLSLQIHNAEHLKQEGLHIVKS